MRNAIPTWERAAAPPRSIRDRVAVAGVGETTYYKHGQAPEPEVKLALQAILAAHPATAELYENMHYEVSGLSRSSLDRSVATELLAAERGILAALDITEHDQLTRSLRLLLARYGLDR